MLKPINKIQLWALCLFIGIASNLLKPPCTWGQEKENTPRPILPLRIFDITKPRSLKELNIAYGLVDQWSSQDPKSPVVAIFRPMEIPNTLLLIFDQMAIMNYSFMRPSIFIEGLSAHFGTRPIHTPHGPIISNRHLVTGKLEQAAWGHDLRGIDLIRYWDTFDSIKRSHMRPLKDLHSQDKVALEGALRESLEPKIRENPDLNLAAVATDKGGRFVLSHELLHMIYFAIPEYREAIRKFWFDKVTPEHRRKIVTALSTQGCRYNPNDEELMINEFQAYILGINAHMGNLAFALDPYFAQLRIALEQTFPHANRVVLPAMRNDFIVSYCSSLLIPSF